jgi:hypothetical protein
LLRHEAGSSRETFADAAGQGTGGHVAAAEAAFNFAQESLFEAITEFADRGNSDGAA